MAWTRARGTESDVAEDGGCAAADPTTKPNATAATSGAVQHIRIVMGESPWRSC